MPNTKREPNIFDKINGWIDGVEGSVINLLTAIAPWLAPTPPAYMTFIHASNTAVLNFPWWVAFAVAFVVEVLGLATVSTGIKFWKYNQKNRRSSDYRKAPVEIVIGAFVFYLAVIITSNVILDATGYFAPELTNYAVVAVKAFYTLLTIPAALIISVRQQHREILDEASSPRITTSSTSSETVSEQNKTGRKSIHQDPVHTYLEGVLYNEKRVASYTEVREALHIPQSTASRIRSEWVNEHKEEIEKVLHGVN